MVHRDVDLPPETKAALDALELLSRKWHPIVLAVLSNRGPVGFNELLESIPDVSGKVLSDALDALDETNLVDRTVVSESPLRVEYELTAAGRDLDAVFDEFAAWANRHFDPVAPTILVADGDRRHTEMFSRWLAGGYIVDRAHSNEEVDAHLDAEVDVALVAESIPGTDARQVSETLHPDARTVLVVEERPDFDVVSVVCDDVIRKPVVREGLVEVIEEQLSRRGESAERRERAALEAKKSLLESVYSAETLASTDAYAELCSQLEALEEDGEK